MIGIEMEMPDRCENCPCSYYIRSGAYKDRLICEVLEKTAPGKPAEWYLVKENQERPKKCPMHEADGIFTEYGRMIVLSGGKK